ncbi:hypothetical protein OAT46_05860 [Gammaproteobacteria bacterium]|nr:hypothetical protein [Gammaproteobacteria bacterium]
MKHILILLASLLVVGNVYAERPLTQQEKSAIVGVYSAKGDWGPKYYWDCMKAFQVDENGELIGHSSCLRDGVQDPPDLNAHKDFKRILPSDWKSL